MNRVRLSRKPPSGLSLDVDFEIGHGTTALFGPSGAGKTLLLELMAGFVTPDSGRILLDDVILYDGESRVNLPPQRRGHGYIPQGGHLFPHLTMRRNLEFAAGRLSRLERHKRVAEALERFELGEAANRLPHETAAADRLRCCFARALLADPRMLLVDQCGMDIALLRRVREVYQRPILFVTGDLDLCCAAADELLVMDAGRILRRGAPAAVLDQPDSLEAARLLGIPNIFQGTIAALDPGRNSSRLEFDGFVLNGPYIRGHFRGDRVWIAVHAGNVRVVSGDGDVPLDSIPVQLIRTERRAQSVRLEFSHGILADLPLEEFARRKDNKVWRVDLPATALRIL